MRHVPRVHLPIRIWVALALPFALLAVGAVGFKATGGPAWTWFDALYMSAITLTTVGYGETHPLTVPGRAFAIVFLFAGVYTLFYAASETIRAIVTGQLRATLGRETVKHALGEIRDHIIVIGLGRMGRLVCQEFDRQKARYVVIDQDEATLKESPYPHGIPVHGDATEDDVLKRAGVERAKVLVTVLPSDADNLYITLSARVLNPDLFIVARAEQEAAEQKLRRVGANQVVAPYLIGGHRVAQAVLRPTVGHFLDQTGRPNATAYQIEEVTVQDGSRLCGKTLREANLRDDHGVVVLALCPADGEFVFSPHGDTVVEARNVLVVVGRREGLDALERLAGEGTT